VYSSESAWLAPLGATYMEVPALCTSYCKATSPGASGGPPGTDDTNPSVVTARSAQRGTGVVVGVGVGGWL